MTVPDPLRTTTQASSWASCCAACSRLLCTAPASHAQKVDTHGLPIFLKAVFPKAGERAPGDGTNAKPEK